jgi:hypothetical protein
LDFFEIGLETASPVAWTPFTFTSGGLESAVHSVKFGATAKRGGCNALRVLSDIFSCFSFCQQSRVWLCLRVAEAQRLCRGPGSRNRSAPIHAAQNRKSPPPEGERALINKNHTK